MGRHTGCGAQQVFFFSVWKLEHQQGSSNTIALVPGEHKVDVGGEVPNKGA